MKISIITVVFNNVSTIKDAIDSVLNQTYENIEYIVVDGASGDGTVDIIKSYGNQINRFISKPDNGLYDAMNKGIKLASGNVIGILNSDDLYYDNTVLKKVADTFRKHPDVQCVYGDLMYVDRNDTSKVVRYWKSSPYIKGSFKKGWHPPHPSFFVKREVYEKHGLFREDMAVAADFELMFRFLEKYSIPSVYIDKILVRMRLGGTSNRSLKKIMEGNRDYKKAFLVNGYKVPFLYTVRRFLPKFIQFIRKPG